tara:strand:+ start:51 stop:1517 length:1467 start_codon:yes stop_codon:yes gene_type:complete
MKITFTNNVSSNDHLVFITFDKKSTFKSKFLDKTKKDLITGFLKQKNKDNGNIFQTFFHSTAKSFSSFSLVIGDNTSRNVELEVLSGKILSFIESKKINNICLVVENIKGKKMFDTLENLVSGLCMKNYRFEKYKNFSRKDFQIQTIKICSALGQKDKQNLERKIESLKGIFLTRDLVSEPANVLYPSKFVEVCNVLKKVGIKIDVLDEKKMKSLGMNALLGVAQGSVRPGRVMIMKWNGNTKSKEKPISFIGKGVTFDTGGISIKPSGGMEDMKWDMGGAGVVAGLMYTLALRKSKANVIGAVGLVENMPDGNAQRPGDVVKSMSGQTIEVLNTDAEGRLVLADVLWYVKEKFKPKLMIDLATLTGAIIVALGERYAGLFSNDNSLVKKILNSSERTNELVWQLPLDEKFDKLLDCQIADMKNITGTRGAGSITAAQFLKRFVGNTSWAHLDIAGVTWSKKGTEFSRPGGTGFGVRLLDDFVRTNYE